MHPVRLFALLPVSLLLTTLAPGHASARRDALSPVVEAEELELEGARPLGPGSDLDGDGFSTAQGDCNDLNAAIHPGAPEFCDHLDRDCDGIAAQPGYATLVQAGVPTNVQGSMGPGNYQVPANATLQLCQGNWPNRFQMQQNSTLRGMGDPHQVVLSQSVVGVSLYAPATVEGVRITGGTGIEIITQNDHLTAIDVIFQNSTVAVSVPVDADIELVGCVLEPPPGGAARQGVDMWQSGQLFISDTRFSGLGSAQSIGGSAIDALHANAVIEDSHFEDNTGGVAAVYLGHSQLRMVNTVFEDNSHLSGAALRLHATGARIASSDFVGNDAAFDQAAIRLSHQATAELRSTNLGAGGSDNSPADISGSGTGYQFSTTSSSANLSCNVNGCVNWVAPPE